MLTPTWNNSDSKVQDFRILIDYSSETVRESPADRTVGLILAAWGSNMILYITETNDIMIQMLAASLLLVINKVEGWVVQPELALCNVEADGALYLLFYLAMAEKAPRMLRFWNMMKEATFLFVRLEDKRYHDIDGESSACDTSTHKIWI